MLYPKTLCLEYHKRCKLLYDHKWTAVATAKVMRVLS